MEWATLIVDLLKGLAWPVVVFLVAWLFRDDLRQKIPGLKKAGPTGIEFDVRQQVVAAASPWDGELKELPGFTRTPTMGEIEKTIHRDLQLIESSARIDLLVRHLAQSKLEAHFERAYGVIFGSQIFALRALDHSGGASREAMLKGFDDSKESGRIPQEFTFEAWLDFLVKFEFIKLGEDDRSYQITELGKDFLLYLTSRGLSDNKMH